MTRLCKIKDFHGFIGGKDNDNIFEEGIIYDVKKILGQIILTPVGKQPKYSKNGLEFTKGTLTEIIIEGDYLIPEINK